VTSARRGGTVRATFTLSRTSQIRATVLTASGATMRTLPARSIPAGSQAVTWNTRTAYGSKVRAGRYQLRVTAQNEIGTVSLTSPFTISR
jgi:flagellar hook assembly protein FlgD